MVDVKHWVRIIAVALATVALPAWPQAASKSPIKFVVPTSPGSVADIGARIVSESMQVNGGQIVLVENRLGAGGSLAAKAVMAAPPDGLTVAILGGTYLLYPYEFPGIAFDPKVDLLPVALIGRTPNAVIVSSNSPYTTLRSLIEDARAKPSKLNYASAGLGSSTFWSAERLRAATNIEVGHIPYKGSPEIMTEVMAGRIDYGFVPVPVALEMVRSGKLRALAVSSDKRAGLLPDVPTTVEAGYVDSAYDTWMVATVPKGTSRAVQLSLNRQIVAAVRVADVAARLRAQGLDPETMDLEAVQSFVAKQYELALKMANAAKSQTKN